MAVCVPTVRSFFYRTWKRGTVSGNERSGSHCAQKLTSISLGRSNVGHKHVGSTTEVELDDLDRYDAESGNPQKGIMRTIKVSMT
jgi:hypothetical protein